jgi:cell division protein FtsN
MVKKGHKTKGKTGRYMIELTSFSAMLWGVFLFFLLIWVFVLGILVGRGFLPGTMTTITELREQIKRLQDIVNKEESYDVKAPGETDSAPELAFYEKLAGKKEEIKNSWEPETEHNTVQEEEQKPSRPPPPPDVLYTVQIASIGDKAKAEKMVIDLIDKGYDAYSYETDIKGNKYYRIRCGKFQSREEALNYAQRLEEQEGFEGFVSRVE